MADPGNRLSESRIRVFSAVVFLAVWKVGAELADTRMLPNPWQVVQGVFDHIADGFSRGFVRAVAEALGLNPDEAVLRLMAEPPEEDDTRARAGARRRFVLGLGLAVALAAVFLGLWAVRRVWIGSDWRQPTPVVVYRRDVVRSLAAAQSTPGRVPGAGSGSVLPADSAPH